MVSLIVAIGNQRQIGSSQKSGLLWRVNEDLKLFREFTKNSTLIVGRKTFETLPKSMIRSENRKFKVITRTPSAFHNPSLNVSAMSSIEEAIQSSQGERVVLIGGGEIYRESLTNPRILPLIDIVAVSEIDTDAEGDIFFPEIPSCFTALDTEHFPSSTPYELKWKFTVFSRNLNI